MDCQALITVWMLPQVQVKSFADMVAPLEYRFCFDSNLENERAKKLMFSILKRDCLDKGMALAQRQVSILVSHRIYLQLVCGSMLGVGLWLLER